jgi:hypothetical protein
MIVFHGQWLSIRAATLVMVVILRAFLAIVLMAIRTAITRITFGAGFNAVKAAGLDFDLRMLEANSTQ